MSSLLIGLSDRKTAYTTNFFRIEVVSLGNLIQKERNEILWTSCYRSRLKAVFEINPSKKYNNPPLYIYQDYVEFQ